MKEKKYLFGNANADVVSRGKIGIKQAIITLRNGGLEILIEQREDESLESPIRHKRGPFPGVNMLDKIAVIRRRIFKTHTRLVRVTDRGPTRFGHHQFHVIIPEFFHRRENRVHLRVEHVRIVHRHGRIPNAAVWFKERVVQALGSGGVEAEERIRVDHEGGLGSPVEVQNRCKDGFVVAVPERGGAGRLRRG